MSYEDIENARAARAAQEAKQEASRKAREAKKAEKDLATVSEVGDISASKGQRNKKRIRNAQPNTHTPMASLVQTDMTPQQLPSAPFRAPVAKMW